MFFQKEISKESLYHKEFILLLKYSFTFEDPEVRFYFSKETFFLDFWGHKSISFFF